MINRLLSPSQTDERGVSVNGEEAPYVYSFNGGSESYTMLTEELSFLPSQGFSLAGWVRQDPGNQG